MTMELKMTYKTNEFECNAVLYDGTNADEVISVFGDSFRIIGGKLYEGSVVINENIYIVKLPAGIKKFSKSIFESLFCEVPEKTYPISDLDVKTGDKIKRALWPADDYIEWTGIVWKYVCEDTESMYTLTPGDLSSKDWKLL